MMIIIMIVIIILLYISRVGVGIYVFTLIMMVIARAIEWKIIATHGIKSYEHYPAYLKVFIYYFSIALLFIVF